METNNTLDSRNIVADLLCKENKYKRDRIVIIGRRSSGKTVFLSLLYEKLWNNNGAIKIKALRGPDHVEYIKAADGIRKGVWPAATQGISQSYLEIEYKDQKRLIVALDYPGEIFTNAFIKNIDSEEVRTLLDHIDHAQAVILLVDPNHMVEDDVLSKTDNDYGLLQAIHRIHNWPEGKDIPVVLVLTKADENNTVLQKHGGLKAFTHKYFTSLITKTEHLKVCVVSALKEIGTVDMKTNHLTSFDVPLLYCMEKITIFEEKQKYFRDKESIAQNIKSYEEIIHKTAIRKEYFWFCVFCIILALFIWFVIWYLPSTVWHNLWENTIGLFI